MTSSPESINGAAHLISVLLVEDNADFAEGLRDILQLFACRVNIAVDGPTALQAVSATRFDLVFCDISLPGAMNGFDIARTIRQLPDLQNLLIVCLSGYAGADDRLRAVEAGFDDLLRKPPELDDIKAILEKARRHRFLAR